MAEQRVAGEPSVAVLAFAATSGDEDEEYLADGISEDIIGHLSKLSGLQVIARNSSFAFKRRPTPAPEVGRALGVRHLLQGSAGRTGDRLRVTAQLLDAASGAAVWSDGRERAFSEVLAVEEALTAGVVAALGVHPPAAERDRLAAGRPTDMRAYELFLRGRALSWAHGRTSNQAAQETFARAIAIDPDYAAAHARLAFTHTLDYINGWTDEPERSLATGVEMAERAVEMDADDAQAHFALAVAMIWTGLLERALAAAERTLALSPSSAEGHQALAHTQIFLGRPRAAVDTIGACFRLDPLFPETALYFLAEAQFSLGDYEQAAAALGKRLARNPRSETTLALLASCYGHLGRAAEARAAWAETLRLKPDYSLERRRHVLPFRNPTDFDRRVEGLRKAGVVVT